MAMNGVRLMAAAGKVHRWQPAADGPTYLLRVPSVADRDEWLFEIKLQNAMKVFPAMLVAELERAVLQMIAEEDPDRARHLATIEAYRAQMDEAAALIRAQHFDPTVSLAEVPALTAPSPELEELIEEIKPKWLPYRRLEAHREKWPRVAGAVAARLFLIGWEGDGLPPFRSNANGGASEDLIFALPPWIIEGLAWEVDRLTEWDWRTLGNLRAGSGSRPGPQPSSSTATHPETAPPATAGT